MLQKTLLVDCNENVKVYYVISELDKEMIKGLRLMINELYKQPFMFNLVSREEDFADNCDFLFHEVQTFV